MPPGTATAQTEAVAPGVLRITVPTLLLDGRRPTDGFPHHQQHIVIQADTIQVRDRYFLPGRHLEIFARRIEAEHGVIDVSGAPVTTRYDIAKADPSLDGTPTSPDGKAGAAGEPGHDAGTLRIMVGEITGDLRLVARGSDGGNSQRGGNGAAPSVPPDARDGQFTLTVKQRAGRSMLGPPVPGLFGSEVVRRPGFRWYWERAFGEKGANGLPGGNAGPPGQAGDGGAGGRIELCYVTAPSDRPQCIVDGGTAGLTGVSAEPGPPGEPGRGGRHLLFQYHLPGIEWSWEKFADDRNSDVRDIVRRYGIPPRAASGAKSHPGIVPEGPTPAVPGRVGTITSRQVQADDIAGECDSSYLDLISESAAADVAHGNVGRALERYQWVAALTRTAHDDERVRLHKEVTQRMEALTQPASLSRT